MEMIERIREEAAEIASSLQEEFADMTNQTVIANQCTTVRNAEVTDISYKGFWTYGMWNGRRVRMYEGWHSWEVVR